MALGGCQTTFDPTAESTSSALCAGPTTGVPVDVVTVAYTRDHTAFDSLVRVPDGLLRAASGSGVGLALAFSYTVDGAPTTAASTVTFDAVRVFTLLPQVSYYNPNAAPIPVARVATALPGGRLPDPNGPFAVDARIVSVGGAANCTSPTRATHLSLVAHAQCWVEVDEAQLPGMVLTGNLYDGAGVVRDASFTYVDHTPVLADGSIDYRFDGSSLFVESGTLAFRTSAHLAGIAWGPRDLAPENPTEQQCRRRDRTGLIDASLGEGLIFVMMRGTVVAPGTRNAELEEWIGIAGPHLASPPLADQVLPSDP